jgi:hypothetical protein
LIPFDLEKLVESTRSLIRLHVLQSQVNQKVEHENHHNRDVGEVICFDRSDEEAVPLHHQTRHKQGNNQPQGKPCRQERVLAWWRVDLAGAAVL